MDRCEEEEEEEEERRSREARLFKALSLVEVVRLSSTSLKGLHLISGEALEHGIMSPDA